MNSIDPLGLLGLSGLNDSNSIAIMNNNVTAPTNYISIVLEGHLAQNNKDYDNFQMDINSPLYNYLLAYNPDMKNFGVDLGETRLALKAETLTRLLLNVPEIKKGIANKTFLRFNLYACNGATIKTFDQKELAAKYLRDNLHTTVTAYSEFVYLLDGKVYGSYKDNINNLYHDPTLSRSKQVFSLGK